MKQRLNNFLKDESGTSAIEYGIICAAIVIGLIAAVDGLADENNGLWATVAENQKEATERALN